MPRNYYATAALAAHYDADNGERPDFAFYLRLAAKLGSQRVIDIGCGTGRLASRLAATGVEVIGLDPQPTMLALARQQPNAPAVRWLEGTADTLPADWADLVLMTGHVAQYFWTTRPGGASSSRRTARCEPVATWHSRSETTPPRRGATGRPTDRRAPRRARLRTRSAATGTS